MGETRIDRALYDSVQSYLQAALEHLSATARSARQLVASVIDDADVGRIPYLKELQNELQNGSSVIATLANSARTAVFGIHVTPERRHEMISEKAFQRAEERGFAGDHAEEDWRAAELEVDALLAAQAGFVEKARKILPL